MTLSLTAWRRQMVVEGHASEFLAGHVKRRRAEPEPVAELDDEGNDVDDPWYFEPMS